MRALIRLLLLLLLSIPASAAVITPACRNVDDTAAVQAALNQIGQQGGGILEFTKPCKITRTLRKSFFDLASSIIIRGHGSASVVTLATGGFDDALVLQNIEHLVIENVVFAGTPISPADVRHGILLQGVLLAVIRDCSFYGLMTSRTYRGGIVRVDSPGGPTELILENTHFFGSTGNSANQSAVVSLENYTRFTARNCKFIDYGTLNSVYHSKTTAGFAWIAAFNPRAATDRGDAFSVSGVFIDKCTFDEGGYFAVVNYPDFGKKTRHVEVTNSVFNSGIAAPVFIARAKYFKADHPWFGWRRALPHINAIQIASVEEVYLDHVDIAPGSTASKLEVDAGTKLLTIINPNFSDIVNSAQRTCITTLLGTQCSS